MCIWFHNFGFYSLIRHQEVVPWFLPIYGMYILSIADLYKFTLQMTCNKKVHTISYYFERRERKLCYNATLSDYHRTITSLIHFNRIYDVNAIGTGFKCVRYVEKKLWNTVSVTIIIDSQWGIF